MMNTEQEMTPNEETEAAPSRMEKMMDELLASGGWLEKLQTPIRRVSFRSQKQADAFRAFVKQIDVGECFTLNELLTGTELIANRTDVVGSAGDAIYLLNAPIADARLRETLLTKSVPGFAALMQACLGAEMCIPEGMTDEQFLSARFYILPERDGARICSSRLVQATKVGTATPGRLRLSDASGDSAERMLNDPQQRAPITLTQTTATDEAFDEGFRCALGYHCCYILPGIYFITMALDRSMEECLAFALGMFDAMLRFRLRMPLTHFRMYGANSLVVPRPNVGFGDKLYAFCPKTDANGVPMFFEVIKLRSYLEQGLRDGKIKSVLPLKKNALEMVSKLGEYEAEQPFPENCFAVLAIMPSTADAPATMLGQFR